MNRFILFFLSLFLMMSCSEDVVPKPKSYLGLNYGEFSYVRNTDSPYFNFDLNEGSDFTSSKKGYYRIEYPNMKASLDMTYRRVDGNLKELMMESEKLTFSHVIKADAISAQDFGNESKLVYGILYTVSGDAATNLQFNLTDSTRHFLTASLYFKVKPNYDSIEPAVHYIKEDIMVLMESLEWKQ